MLNEPALDEFLCVGRIVGAHGIRGEVKVLPLTDYPEERFTAGSHLLLGDERRQCTIRSSRSHKNMVLVVLEGVEDRNQAEELRGSDLFIPQEGAAPLPAGSYWEHDLLGLQVVTTDGREVGTVEEILHTGSNDVYAVSGPHGQVLVPALKDVVSEVDLAAGRLVIHPVAGLLDEAFQ